MKGGGIKRELGYEAVSTRNTIWAVSLFNTFRRLCLHYQGTFVDVSLLAIRPNTIILMVSRRVQEKVLNSKKRPFSRVLLAGDRYVSYSVHDVSAWRIHMMIWTETRRKTDSWRSCFTIRWTNDRQMFSCPATFLVLLLVFGWFSCEQISSPTCLTISCTRTDLGRFPPGFLMTADPVSSTRLQISLTVTFFQFLSGCYTRIVQYPSSCSRRVWILMLSSTETLPMIPAINQQADILSMLKTFKLLIT